jgi:hypothetical protein
VVGHAAQGETLEIGRADPGGWARVHRGSTVVGYVRALPRYVRVQEGTAPQPAGETGGRRWWIVAGLAAALAGVVLVGLVRRRGARAGAPAGAARSADLARYLDAAELRAGPVYHLPQSEMTVPFPEPGFTSPAPASHGADDGASERNGRAFEEWAVEKLGRWPFHLKEWRGDKYVNGVFAESTLDPDLVIEYRDGTDSARFAVECKWRSRYWDDGLRWGKHKHLHRYRRYAREKHIPVYLLLGVGGTGGSPEDVYLLPLEHVQYPILYRRELRSGDSTDGDGVFVFDTRSRRLRLVPSHRDDSI